jgi:hypothetical protein
MTQVVVVEPASLRLDVPNKGASSIKYQVLDDAGNPLPGAMVVNHVTSGGTSGDHLTGAAPADANGYVTFKFNTDGGLTSWCPDPAGLCAWVQQWAVAVGCDYGHSNYPAGRPYECLTEQYPAAISPRVDCYFWAGLVPCTEGELRDPQSCPDGSMIYGSVCQSGAFVPTGQVCETQPPPGCVEGREECRDGLIWRCVGGEWLNTQESCAPPPVSALPRWALPAIGIGLLGSVIAAVAMRRR